MLKCFLGALFTYQVAYWVWLKLETLEARKDMNDEITSLNLELTRAILKQKVLIEERQKKKLEEEGKDKVTDKVAEVAKKWW
ncbi:hypothetical protein K504DRAFT_501548 [Pleomassaria siparia CBS 279.74]|uniref:Uncharacterized protein n=1 Tax=Pleomassaria siparia CBS 279.74 TaxID=1314801 RepID=A0A6G1KBK3_9PLEO|nr:hypothetical protein K504DRAFT_501548 [Pleomassaria siparia CBS 279.74]